MNTKQQANRDRDMVASRTVNEHRPHFYPALVGRKRAGQIVARNQRSMWGNPDYRACDSTKPDHKVATPGHGGKSW